MFTVITITDEPLIGCGLRSFFGELEEFRLLGCFEEIDEFRRAAAQLTPDVLLCALRGEHETSFLDLRSASARSAIVILRRDFSPEYAHHALEIGIRGLISTTADAAALKQCLSSTARGELWMENSLSMKLLDTRPIHLSKRQTELVRLLAQGLKNKEIASFLGISEGTVKAYLTTLFEKVGAKDRFELALFGLRWLRNFSAEPLAPSHPSRTQRIQPSRAGKLNVA